MIMDDSWFPEWFLHSATQDEKRLYDKIISFGEFFDDMLFQEGTCTHDLIKCKIAYDNDELIDEEAHVPDELHCFSYTWFHLKVEKLNGPYDGCFNSEKQELCICPEKVDDDLTILHEMIHLHEFVIDELPLYIHDMVLWALYQDLKQKIPQLDKLINSQAHMLIGSTLYHKGGLHDILFLLKSLDLDIRQNYPLGTVFSYGRTELFKQYHYDIIKP